MNEINNIHTQKNDNSDKLIEELIDSLDINDNINIKKIKTIDDIKKECEKNNKMYCK